MASRPHYKFSPETLSYQKVPRNFFHRFFGSYPFWAAALIAVLVIGVSFLVPSRTERIMANKNSALKKELKHLQQRSIQFEEAMAGLSEKDDSLYRAILGTAPLSDPIREAGLGGVRTTQTVGATEFVDEVNEIATRLDRVNAQLRVQDESFRQLFSLASKKNKDLEYIPAIMPIENKDLSRTGSGFGMRFHPILKIWRMHEGIDFYARTGTPVYATADGRVKAQRFSTTFGKLIVIDHGNDLETYYAHLSAYEVKKGQKVKRGQVIARVGSTGLSSGPHLHYEVHRNRKEIDPVNYFFNDLTPEQYEIIVDMASREMNSMD